MIDFDNSFRDRGFDLLAGTDEAGRGPLAGPVVGAAVVFDKSVSIVGVKDSKKTTEKDRIRLYDEILDKAISAKFTVVSNNDIDDINILQASLKAMRLSIENLSCKPDYIIVDGNKVFTSSVPIEAIVKGDDKSFTIAAASIIAKVARDRIMVELANEFPMYGWDRNKGYPTKEHREAIIKYGVTKYHRKTFLKKLFAGQYEIFE